MRSPCQRVGLEQVHVLAHRDAVTGGCLEGFTFDVKHDERPAPGKAVRYDPVCRFSGAGRGMQGHRLAAAERDVAVLIAAKQNIVVAH
jgi:hypothetical protein